MAKTAVGIYISSKYVDIVELGGSKGAPKLLNFTRQEIPKASPAQPEESNAADKPKENPLSAVIRDALSKTSIDTKDVYTVLPSSDAMIRYFDMPSLPRSEQRQAIKFEAKKYIPFKLDDIVSDFKVISSATSKSKMSVFYIAATKANLNSHMDILTAAGTKTVGVDIIPFSLIRVLLLAKKTDNKENIAVLYLDNDRENATIHIMEAGMPFMSRDIKIQSDDKDALFEKLSSDIRVSIDYYQRQKPKAEISKILVCGESIFTGVDAYISEELKIITETLEDLSIVKAKEQLPTSAIIAAGTAFEGLGKSNYSVNLSPVATAITKQKHLNIMAAEIIGAIFVILAIFLISAIPTKTLSGKLKTIESQGVTLSKDTAKLNTKMLKDRKESIIDEVKFLNILINDKISWAKKLERISVNLQDGLWIEKLDIVESKTRGKSEYLAAITYGLSIVGNSFLEDESKETGQVNKFLEALKNDKEFMLGFKSIEIASQNRKEVEGHWITSFVINIDMQSQSTDRKGRRR